MKTIEERAYARYAGDACPADCESCEFRPDCSDVDYVQAYIDGARSEHDLLTEWHDPKTDRPPIGRAVLLIMQCEDGGHIYTEYAVGDRLEGDCYVSPVPYVGWEVVGWREIHE